MSTDSRFVHKMWQEEELSKMVRGRRALPHALRRRRPDRHRVRGVRRGSGGGHPRSIHHRSRLCHPGHGSDDTRSRTQPRELLRQVKAFQHNRATGEVMPSGWQPGEKTLKPGPALVGKVWQEWKP